MLYWPWFDTILILSYEEKICLHLWVNCSFRVGEQRADKPFLTSHNPKRNSWEQLFRGWARDRQSLFMCVHERVSMCEPTVQFSCDSILNRGYTRLWRHCSASLLCTKPGVCLRECLASPPNISSCCWTPTVARHSEALHWPTHGQLISVVLHYCFSDSSLLCLLFASDKQCRRP